MNPERIPLLPQLKATEAEKVPPLIDDVRNNALIISKHNEGTVRIKYPAYSSVVHQALLVPDKDDKSALSDITVAPNGLLTHTLQTASDISEYFLQQPDMNHVEIGYHFSGQEKRKGVASQPHFHVHVVGYTETDLNSNTVTPKEAKNNHHLRIQMKEPLKNIIYDILATQVIPELEDDADFSSVLKPKISSGKVSYEFQQIEGLTDPKLPFALKHMHVATQKAYNLLADCFFEKEDDKFVLGIEDRYVPLPISERKSRLRSYFEQEGKSLSSKSKLALVYLAENAQEMEEIYNRPYTSKEKGEQLSTDEIKKRRFDRFALINNLAYSVIFSAQNTPEGAKWTIGFEPMAFTKRGFPQASPVQMKLVSQLGGTHVDEMKHRIHEHEENMKNHLLTLPSNRYQEAA